MEFTISLTFFHAKHRMKIIGGNVALAEWVHFKTIREGILEGKSGVSSHGISN